jgi:hypothetical protein
MEDFENIFNNMSINDNIQKIINEEIELLKCYILNSINENVYDDNYFSIEPNEYILSNNEYQKIKLFFENNPDYLFQNLIKKLDDFINTKNHFIFNFINKIINKYISQLNFD